MGFDLTPERTLAITFRCPWKGTEKLGKVFFYVTKANEKVMVLPEAHMLHVCRRAGPLGAVVWEVRGRVERFWAEHGRMPTNAEVRSAA